MVIVVLEPSVTKTNVLLIIIFSIMDVVRLPFLFLDLMQSCMLNNLNLLFGMFMIISHICLGLLLIACY